MTVGELKQILADVDDNLEVIVFNERHCPALHPIARVEKFLLVSGQLTVCIDQDETKEID